MTLRSASPRHREHPERRQDDQAAYHSTYPMTNLQPAKWDSYEPQSTSVPTIYPQQSYYNTHYATKWKSWGKCKDYSKSHDTSNPPGQWIDYTQQSQHDTSHNDDSTRPLTAYSSNHYTSHYHTRRQSHRSGSIQSRTSTAVPPGHVPIDLHAGSTKNWARAVKFALEHPDRMRAANEIPASERPQPSTTMDEEQYTKACEELQHVDERIPKEIVERAVQLFFSTHLLPDYDLSTCYTIDLHSANMIALIMPLPQTSKFQMPPPFGKSKNYTWALVHGTSVTSAQQILIEGKIRPANWTYHKNPQRSDLPSFGAFFLGRHVANSDSTIPPWAEKELLCSADKKGKGQQDILIGAMYHGAYEHISFQAGGNEKAQLRVADIGVVTTSEKYTIANSHNVGLKFVAMKWPNLTMRVDLGESTSGDCTYRGNEERCSRHRRR